MNWNRIDVACTAPGGINMDEIDLKVSQLLRHSCSFFPKIFLIDL